MNSICPEINIVIKMAIETGNEIKEKSEDWSIAKQVLAMKNKLELDLKNQVENKVKKLRYWNYEGSPHDEPDEGFSCDGCKVVISFPVVR